MRSIDRNKLKLAEWRFDKRPEVSRDEPVSKTLSTEVFVDLGSNLKVMGYEGKCSMRLRTQEHSAKQGDPGRNRRPCASECEGANA